MRLGINGRLLISVGADRVVRIWDTRQVGKACIASMRGHQKEINVSDLPTSSMQIAFSVWRQRQT